MIPKKPVPGLDPGWEPDSEEIMLQQMRMAWTARTLMRGVAALLVLALLVQFFIAGMAALTNPGWWAYHQAWVAIFQWLVVPLPVLAWLAGPPRRYRVPLACLPFAQIALQYVLAHRAIIGRWPIGLGLHAVDAALMLIVVVALVIDGAGHIPPDHRA